MKKTNASANKINYVSALILKYGTIIATIVLILAFFSDKYGIDMCTVSVYMFAEAVISALLFDVIARRRQ